MSPIYQPGPEPTPWYEPLSRGTRGPARRVLACVLLIAVLAIPLVQGTCLLVVELDAMLHSVGGP